MFRTSRAILTSCALASVLLTTSLVQAGPVELLDGVVLPPGASQTVLLRYRNGGGGLLLSHDAGKTFSFLCNTAIDPTLRREASSMAIREDGAILMGVFNGLWRGDENACGFTQEKAFDGQWLTDFAVDPLDASHTFAITSAGGKMNGIYENDGKGESWTQVGSLEEILINRLFVVPNGTDKVRMYESAVRGSYQVPAPDGGVPDELPKYVIRVSDDRGKTWTEHEFGQTEATLRLLGVDPTDPDRIVIGLLRDTFSEGGAVSDPDELLYSDKAGEAGSFQKIGEVTELCDTSGSWCPNGTFASDGRFFYGDREQTTPALYVVPKLGDAPKKLSDEAKVQCVHFDARSDTLYVCHDRELGTVDAKGAFTQLIDVTKADTWLACTGATDTQLSCAAQMEGAWCGITHFPATPLCAGYDFVDAGAPAADGGGSGSDASASEADASTASDAGKTPEKKDDGGCSVSRVAPSAPDAPTAPRWMLVLGLCALLARRRSQRQCR